MAASMVRKVLTKFSPKTPRSHKSASPSCVEEVNDKVTLTESEKEKDKKEDDHDGQHTYISPTNLTPANVIDIVVNNNVARLRPDLYRRLKGLPPSPKSEADKDVNKYNKTPSSSSLTYKYSYCKEGSMQQKLYAKFGSASGVDPALLWPSSIIIQRERAKLKWSKPLAERIEDMKKANRREKEEMDHHQKLVSERMENMDKFIEQYEQRKKKRFQQDTDQVTRRQKLLEEAREFFGYEVNHKDIKFQQMVEWKEEQEKRAKKLRKKQSKEGYLAQKVAKLTAELQVTSPSDNPE